MKIVVLDGYTLNPGDIGWDELQTLGEVTVYDRTSPADVVKRALGAQAIYTNKTCIGARELDALPGLEFIGVLATGYNVVDVSYAAQKGITVCNIPTYGTASVAQFVFVLILELCHHVQYHSDRVHEGAWNSCKDFCFWEHPLIELAGKTLGIIGCGRIGLETAKIGAAFGMNILGYDSRPVKTDIPCFVQTELTDLLSRSDFISLHCPLFDETKEMINRDTLSHVKPGAFLINTSRGPLVQDAALYEALTSGRLAGAALDVLSSEPPSVENPLLSAPNCIITPHIAWGTKEARMRLMKMAVENLSAYIAGTPQNVVNK